jgi:hypothetical protein
MAAAPTFSSTRKKAGLPIIPLGIGVVAVIVITIYALTRGAPRDPAAPSAAPARSAAADTKAAEPASPSPAPPPPETAVPATASGPAPGEQREPPRPAAPPVERRAVREPARAARNEGAAQVREPPRREPVVAAAVRPAAAPAVPTPAAPEPPAPPPEPAPAQAELFKPAAPAETPAATPLQIGPSYAREGMKKARLADPGCLAGNLRLPRDLSLEGESATVKFAVDQKGAVSKYEYLAGPADGRVSVAIWNAIQRCEFLPGTSASGQPIPLWMTIPIRFGK